MSSSGWQHFSANFSRIYSTFGSSCTCSQHSRDDQVNQSNLGSGPILLLLRYVTSVRNNKQTNWRIARRRRRLRLDHQSYCRGLWELHLCLFADSRATSSSCTILNKIVQFRSMHILHYKNNYIISESKNMLFAFDLEPCIFNIIKKLYKKRIYYRCT